MGNNTKLLSLLTFLFIIFGLGFLWFGFSPPQQITETQITPVQQKIESPVINIATESSTFGLEGEKALVVRVVDGDTLEIENGKKVRFVGINTPETVDPKRPVECFGKEASNKTKSLLTNKVVILQKDISETDKYGRLLRYVFLPLPDGQTLFVDDYLVREGFAKVLTYPPDVKYNDQFLKAQEQAKKLKKGLWGAC